MRSLRFLEKRPFASLSVNKYRKCIFCDMGEKDHEEFVEDYAKGFSVDSICLKWQRKLKNKITKKSFKKSFKIHFNHHVHNAELDMYRNQSLIGIRAGIEKPAKRMGKDLLECVVDRKFSDAEVIDRIVIEKMRELKRVEERIKEVEKKEEFPDKEDVELKLSILKEIEDSLLKKSKIVGPVPDTVNNFINIESMNVLREMTAVIKKFVTNPKERLMIGQELKKISMENKEREKIVAEYKEVKDEG